MNPERRRQIEGRYYAALEREPGAREVFLGNACREDADLRQEVESLLAQEGTAAPLLDEPLEEMAGRRFDERFASGTMVGPYPIVERLVHLRDTFLFYRSAYLLLPDARVSWSEG